MIGQTYFIGDRMYLQVNDQGTLEKLPILKWYFQLHLYILTRFKKMTVVEVEDYVREKSGPVVII